MEPVVATGGNRSQIASARKPRNQAETVAVGCDRLPEGAHGKEGVNAGRRDRCKLQMSSLPWAEWQIAEAA